MTPKKRTPLRLEQLEDRRVPSAPGDIVYTYMSNGLYGSTLGIGQVGAADLLTFPGGSPDVGSLTADSNGDLLFVQGGLYGGAVRRVAPGAAAAVPVADIPNRALTDEAPVYRRPMTEPAYIREAQQLSLPALGAGISMSHRRPCTPLRRWRSRSSSCQSMSRSSRLSSA